MGRQSKFYACFMRRQKKRMWQSLENSREKEVERENTWTKWHGGWEASIMITNTEDRAW